MSSLNWQELKERVSIEQVLFLLNVETKPLRDQLRGCCPIHKGDDPRELVVTPAKGLWYCFKCKQGGDSIKLFALANNCSLKEAAQRIADSFNGETEETAPEAMTPLDYLEARHPAVECLGFDPSVAEKLGIGFAKKGIMRDLVAIPIRLPDGTLSGYIGITDAKLPKSFKGVS